MFKLQEEIKFSMWDYVKRILSFMLGLLLVFICMFAFIGNASMFFVNADIASKIFSGIASLVMFICVIINTFITYGHLLSIITMFTKRIFYFKTEQEVIETMLNNYESDKGVSFKLMYLLQYTNKKIFEMFRLKGIVAYLENYREEVLECNPDGTNSLDATIKLYEEEINEIVNGK